MQTPEAFVVGYSPVRAAGRVARAESLVRRGLWSVGIYIVLSVVLWFLFRRQLSPAQFLIGGVPAGLIVIGFLVWRYLELRSARQSLGRVPAGEALRIDHRGVHVDEGAQGQGAEKLFDWPGLADLRVAGSKLGTGPDLTVEHRGGSWSVPLSYLDTLPGTIDSAIRAYSGGRRGLDLSGLDSIWGE